jgi:hypothetical protein
MKRRPTKKDLQREAEIEQARDAGRGWFVNNAEQLASAASREASRMYDSDGRGKAYVLAFIEGFQQARLRRDEWLKERSK